MGGSGGGTFFTGKDDPNKVSGRIRKAEEGLADDDFVTKVNELLKDLLTCFNDRDVEGIQDILDDIKTQLKNEIDTHIDMLFGGSIEKHTYVDGLSDVDSLVVLRNLDSAEISPEKLKTIFADSVKSKYGEENVSVGQMAVTLNVDGKEIQLLPAIRDGEKFKIASSDGKQWSKINPKAFNEKLTTMNKHLGSKLVPVIKLMKACVANFPEQRRLTGYHVESLAIECFKGYAGSKTHKAMLEHFCSEASKVVLSPIRDSSGQSVHVDEYMGKADSLERRIVSDSFKRLARRIRNANGSKSMDKWRKLF